MNTSRLRFLLPLSLCLTGCADDPEADGFYLHPNGITVRCQDAVVGDVGVVDGMTYTKVSEIELDLESTSDSQEWGFFCTSGVRHMHSLFAGARTFNQDISTWDTSSVTDMSSMFSGAREFNKDIGDWDTSSVTDMSVMFINTEVFNKNIGDWDTGNVNDMNYMFFNADSFNQDIGAWRTGSVNEMNYMFTWAESFNQDLGDWCVRLIQATPDEFDEEASSWTRSQPRWGTCP